MSTRDQRVASVIASIESDNFLRRPSFQKATATTTSTPSHRCRCHCRCCVRGGCDKGDVNDGAVDVRVGEVSFHIAAPYTSTQPTSTDTHYTPPMKSSGDNGGTADASAVRRLNAFIAQSVTFI